MMKKRILTAILAIAFAGTLAVGFAACDPTPPPAHECTSVCPTCNKCTDADCTDPVCADKCKGHENPPPHTCESKCPTCNKCTDANCTDPVCADKCKGHENPPPHTCESKCPTCNKCTDADCTDPVCADKCEGHENPNPVELGAFARKWYGKNGVVLDLNKKTYTAAKDFKVTAVEGEKAQTVISCSFDGKNYELNLHADGYLALYEVAAAAQDDEEQNEIETAPEPVATFYADASEYTGAWINSDPTSSFYYLIDTKPNENGEFSLITCSRYQGYSNDDPLTSVFVFNEDGTAQVKLENDYYSFYAEDGTRYVLDGYWYWGASYVPMELTPFDFLGYAELGGEQISYGYNDTKNYLTDDNRTVDFDFETNKIDYDTRKTTYERTTTELGAGYAFAVNKTTYMLQLLPRYEDGLPAMGIVTVSGTFRMVKNDPLALLGTWTSGNGNVRISMGQNGRITFKDGASTTNNITPEPFYNDNGVAYRFERSNHVYKLYTIQDVGAAIRVECDYAAHQGYYVSEEARNVFFGSYTTNLQTLVIGEDQTITTKSLVRPDEAAAVKTGVFTYSPELECVALTFDGGSKLFVLAETGILWEGQIVEVRDGDKVEYQLDVDSTHLSAEAVETAKGLIMAGLLSESDKFVTGLNGSEITFDFTGTIGQIVIDGKSYAFSWDVTANGAGILTPSMIYVGLNEDGDAISAAGTLEPNGRGVTLTKLNPETFDLEGFFYYVSDEELHENLGRSFVFQGQFYQERILFTEDGIFKIDTTDDSDSDTAVTLVAYNYTLMSWDSLNGHAFVVGFQLNDSDLSLYVYMYDDYATLFDIVYTETTIADFAGSYYAENGAKVTLTEKGKLDYSTGGAMATPQIVTVKSAELKDGAYTLTFTLGVSEAINTVVFSANGATLTLDQADPVSLVKAEFNPYVFLGAYRFETGEGETKTTTEIVISLTTEGVNFVPTLQATVTGAVITTVTLSYTADGKQVATVTPFLAPDGYIFTYDGTAMTLTYKGTTVTVTGLGISDYSRFAFEGEKTLTADGETHTLKAVPKENGKTPMFLYDNAVCTILGITVNKDGTATMKLTALSDGESVTVLVTLAADGTVTAAYPASEIPIPPPPLPAPAL